MLDRELKHVADYLKNGKQPEPEPAVGTEEAEENFRDMIYRLRSAGPPRVNLEELPDTIDVSDLDEETIDALAAFGLNAAGALNLYATQLEDDLIATIRRLTAVTKEFVEMRRSFVSLQCSVRDAITAVEAKDEA